MSLFINITEKSVFKEDFENNKLYNMPSRINNTRKCNINNKLGIITPKIIDDFPLSSFVSVYKEKEIQYGQENYDNKDKENDPTTENKKKKLISKQNQIIQVKVKKINKELNKNSNSIFSNQEYIRKICGDTKESIIQCKPMLSSTASKTFMRDYSNSEKYKEDKELLILSPNNNKPKNILLDNYSIISSPNESKSSKSSSHTPLKTKMDQENQVNIPQTNNFNNPKKEEKSNDDNKIEIEKVGNLNINNTKENKKSKKYDYEEFRASICKENTDDMELEDLIKYQENHLPVPLNKKDNEKFKILTIKKMKRPSMPPNKSVRKFAEDMEPQYEKDFRIDNAYSTMRKKKPVHSTRKIYSSNFVLHKNNGEEEKFMVFRDRDIGVYEYWQAHIHEAYNDEDLETDDEQKKIARTYSIGEVKESFEFIINNGISSFTNFNRFSHFIDKENNVTEKLKNFYDRILSSYCNKNIRKNSIKIN